MSDLTNKSPGNKDCRSFAQLYCPLHVCFPEELDDGGLGVGLSGTPPLSCWLECCCAGDGCIPGEIHHLGRNRGSAWMAV